MQTNTAQVTEINRSPSAWVTPAQVRGLLKNNLGLNAKKTSVSAKHGSQQYLVITIRDAAVDIKAVEKFAKTLNTWNMDITDYVSGQSIEVKTTGEVDEAHAAPFIEEIKALIPQLTQGGGKKILNGAILWNTDQGFYISRDTERTSYVYAKDVLNMESWAIERLALNASRI